jgi:hypothetical protein
MALRAIIPKCDIKTVRLAGFQARHRSEDGSYGSAGARRVMRLDGLHNHQGQQKDRLDDQYDLKFAEQAVAVHTFISNAPSKH